MEKSSQRICQSSEHLTERLVRFWADFVLYYHYPGFYQLYNHSGEPLGSAIYADCDGGAIKEVVFREREKARC